MQPAPNKFLTFLAFVVGVGLIYPLIMTAIFKFDLKISMIVGAVMGVVGGVLWVTTSNIREKRKAMRK